MARYINAELLASEIEKYNKDNWDKLTWSSHMVHSLIMNAPAVDATEVIRCKNCRWYVDNNHGQWYGCWLFQAILQNEKEEPKQNDFCSLGEKME